MDCPGRRNTSYIANNITTEGDIKLIGTVLEEETPRTLQTTSQQKMTSIS